VNVQRLYFATAAQFKDSAPMLFRFRSVARVNDAPESAIVTDEQVFARLVVIRFRARWTAGDSFSGALADVCQFGNVKTHRRGSV
jgi:hypothetical protein